MAYRRNLDKSLASEKVDIIFYLVMEKAGKRMLKPLKLDTKVSLGVVRAIAADTVVPGFYVTLARNLLERGVPAGSKVQVRAKFGPAHEMLDPVLKGVRVLCEVDV
jgi:hypothetical protein